MKKLTAAERREQRKDAIDRLRGLIRPTDTIYIKQIHVSRTGETRRVVVLIVAPSYDVNPKPAIRDVSRLVAIATDHRYDEKTHEVYLYGIGTDKHFELVYDLSRVLFADGPFHGDADGRPDPGRFLTKETL